MTEYKMAGWHHVLNGRESDKALRDSEGQISLVCCNPWGSKEPDMTEQLNKKTMQNQICYFRLHREAIAQQG